MRLLAVKTLLCGMIGGDTMVRTFKASRSAVLVSDVRFFFRFLIPDVIAGAALLVLLVLLPVLGALLF